MSHPAPLPRLTGLPELSWIDSAGVADYDPAEGVLTLTSAAGSDWSNDATGGPQQHDSASLSFTPTTERFALSALVAVPGERTTFDAAVLTIWYDRDHWAKLCFEFSPQGQAMVVSVVTDVFSDDANSTIVDDPQVHLRVSSLGGGAWAFHSSADGVSWDFVRLFRLPEGEGPLRVGFMSQSPMGPATLSRFSQITLHETPPADLRHGE